MGKALDVKLLPLVFLKMNRIAYIFDLVMIGNAMNQNSIHCFHSYNGNCGAHCQYKRNIG